MQFDPSDPELNAAAAKIQASFRGHKVRKELKKTADEIDMPTPKIETNAVVSCLIPSTWFPTLAINNI